MIEFKVCPLVGAPGSPRGPPGTTQIEHPRNSPKSKTNINKRATFYSKNLTPVRFPRTPPPDLT